MTIASQLSQTLANMEGAAANLKTFASQTQNQQAKQLVSGWRYHTAKKRVARTQLDREQGLGLT